MKKGLLGLFLSACFLMAFNGSASAGVLGSSHDLTTLIPGLTQPCKVCHTPHNAKNIPDVPLSNRNAPTGPYTLYSSSTLDATVEQPGGTDLMCLSCHDGTMAVDSYGRKIGSIYLTHGVIGTDLSNDHPVSFNYPNAAALDSGITAVSDPKGSEIAPFKLFSNYMRCATCHDVHNNTGNAKFLRASRDSSTFCITCHKNK